jgi:hypothetical protein
MKPKQNYSTDAGVSNVRDCCQTPDYALDPLLPYLRPDWRVWECAAGEGMLVRALRPRVAQVIASDLLTGEDFFDERSLPEEFDAVVTNPPFSIKVRFLERCYALGKPFALLMPVETLGSQGAQKSFARYGVEVILMNRRVDFKMPNKGYAGAGAQFPSAWFTWGLDIGAMLTFAEITKGVRRQQEQLQMPLFAEKMP